MAWVIKATNREETCQGTGPCRAKKNNKKKKKKKKKKPCAPKGRAGLVGRTPGGGGKMSAGIVRPQEKVGKEKNKPDLLRKRGQRETTKKGRGSGRSREGNVHTIDNNNKKKGEEKRNSGGKRGNREVNQDTKSKEGD